MAGSKQKKFKFSKGEVNEKLLERQDIDILESSASYIKNMVSTPYGSIRTRGGTKNVAKIATNKTVKTPNTVTNNIGGTTAYITDFTNIFQSTGIGAQTTLIKLDYGSSSNIYKSYLENCYIDFVEPEFSITRDADGVITGVTIVDGGKGLNNCTLTVSDSRGEDAELTCVTNSAGTITTVTIVDGGTNYTSQAVIVPDYDPIEVDILLQGSTDNTNWTTLDTYTFTDEETDFVTEINASYRYLRLYMSDAFDTELNLYNWSSYSNATTTLTKLVPFVFNLAQKYVLVLKDEEIKIYQNDSLLSTVTATGLQDTYFEDLKTTQAEDTMIFTHEDMRTKQLKRSYDSRAYTNDPAAGSNITLNIADTSIFAVNDTVIVSSSAGSEVATITTVTTNTNIVVNTLALNHTTSNPLVTSMRVVTWTFGDFPWTNVPYALFGAETTTNPAFTLTPSDVEGNVTLTASGASFTSASVGQLIDGNGGRVRITEYVSTTVVQGYTIIPFYTTAAIASGAWDYITGYEAAWSELRGYPKTCMFYQQRLWFFGSKNKPNTAWASRVGQYTSFENIGNYDNDAINATISSEQIDEIVNVYANRGIQVFTAGAEWVVPEGATTPDSISFTKTTSNGSLGSVRPVDIAGTTLFVEKNGQSMLGFVYSDTQASNITTSMSLLTSLVDDPIAMTVDYNSSVDAGNFLYLVRGDGILATFCIIIDQNINSPSRFITDGLFIDVVNVAGDTYVLVDRKDVIYLEKLEYQKTDWTTTNTSHSASISGLSDYNGYYVHVYNDTDYGTHFVMNGAITLSATPTEDVYIGIEFDYELISTKIAINGQTENIEKRISKATVTTKDTTSLTFCGQTISNTDDVYDFYGVTSPSRDCRFAITGTFDVIEVLSILLNINYGDK